MPDQIRRKYAAEMQSSSQRQNEEIRTKLKVHVICEQSGSID